MSKNDEGLSVVPRRGTFMLVVPDTMCFEVVEVGQDAAAGFPAEDAA